MNREYLEKLEFVFAKAAREVKEILANANMTGTTSMIFIAKAEGYIYNDLKLEFQLESIYESDRVEGGTVTAVVEEYLRRKGWTQRNAPLCLPNVEQPKEQSNDILDTQEEHGAAPRAPVNSVDDAPF